MSNFAMNNNWQEYDFSTEFLLLCCNKPFHFCSKGTHITFLQLLSKRHVNMNRTFQVMGLLRPCLVSSVLTHFAN